MKKTLVLVIFAHLVIIVACTYHLETKRPFKKPQMLKVQTVVLQPIVEKKVITESAPVIHEPEPVVTAVQEEKVAPVVKAEEKKQVAPPPAKKKEVKKPQKKKEAKKPKVEKETKQDKLLANVEESIAKIGKKSDKLPPKDATIALPKTISSLKAESGVERGEVTEIGYEDELAYYLKAQLMLPEHGDVVVKLTLKRTGSVLSVKIVSAESKKNRAYVEKTLPSLTFPAFGSSFKGQNEHLFTLTLSSQL